MNYLNIIANVNESLLRQSGKIYVVVGVICIIFVCVAAYLIYLNQKIKKLEK